MHPLAGTEVATDGTDLVFKWGQWQVGGGGTEVGLACPDAAHSVGVGNRRMYADASVGSKPIVLM